MNKKYIGLLLMLLAAIIGGGTQVFAKIILLELESVQYLFLRFILASIGVIFLLLFSGKKQQKNFNTGKMRPLFGVSLFAVANVCFATFGIKYTTAISAQTLYVLTPVITLILAYFFLARSILKKQVAGMLLGLLGAMLIVFLPYISDTEALATGSLLGNVLILGGVLSFSLYLIFSKRLSKYYSPLIMNSVFIVITLCATLVWLLIDGGFSTLHAFSLSWKAIGGLVYVGIIATTCYFWIYQVLVKKLSSVNASLILYLQPIATVIWSLSILHEQLTVLFVVGSLVTFVGVWLVERK